MRSKTERLYALIGEVRLCFNLLKALTEQRHADLNVSTSMRAVMEGLFQEKPKTVPEIAREKGVSRQHIQLIINALLKRKLIEAVKNPAHKASPLYALTGQGRSVFTTIKRREQKDLLRFAGSMSLQSLEQVQTTLRALNKKLGAEILETV